MSGNITLFHIDLVLIDIMNIEPGAIAGIYIYECILAIAPN